MSLCVFVEFGCVYITENSSRKILSSSVLVLWQVQTFRKLIIIILISVCAFFWSDDKEDVKTPLLFEL